MEEQLTKEEAEALIEEYSMWDNDFVEMEKYVPAAASAIKKLMAIAGRETT